MLWITQLVNRRARIQSGPGLPEKPLLLTNSILGRLLVIVYNCFKVWRGVWGGHSWQREQQESSVEVRWVGRLGKAGLGEQRNTQLRM